MTKREIAKLIAEELGLTHQLTQRIVQKTLDTLVEVLMNEGQVELRNFGKFKLKYRPQRIRRNPKTGKQVTLPEGHVVQFRAGKELIDRAARKKNPDPSSKTVSDPTENEL